MILKIMTEGIVKRTANFMTFSCSLQRNELRILWNLYFLQFELLKFKYCLEPFESNLLTLIVWNYLGLFTTIDKPAYFSFQFIQKISEHRLQFDRSTRKCIVISFSRRRGIAPIFKQSELENQSFAWGIKFLASLSQFHLKPANNNNNSRISRDSFFLFFPFFLF